MAPLRRKKRVSSSSSSADTTASPAPDNTSPAPNIPPQHSTATPTTKSPLRRVNGGGISKTQKAALLENLKLEINERIRKLRAQYAAQGRALKQRIEMRINRVPKKLWKVKMGELLSQADAKAVTSSMASVGDAKKFVEDVRSLSRTDDREKEKIVVPKKRVVKKTVPSTKEQMPPPQMPGHPLGVAPSRSNLPPSSSPQRPASPAKSTTSTKSRTARTRKPPPPPPSHSARPISQATTRSSLETAATGPDSFSSSASTRGTKSSQAKSAAAKSQPRPTVTTSNSGGLKRGGVKGTGSTGSLKENRVAGVKKEPVSRPGSKAERTGSTGRVLRSRK